MLLIGIVKLGNSIILITKLGLEEILPNVTSSMYKQKGNFLQR